MFDILPRALASVASVLFPVFASYKALNSADPAQLTPWLMYWVVLASVGLVESWADWLLVWLPFFQYLRLFFLLYLVLPQTQGARVLYQTHLHPWLAEHEARIDDMIGSAHEKLRAAGLQFLRRALAQLRELLGLPAADEGASSASAAPSSPDTADASYASYTSYTQSLLARFTLPSARWPGGAADAGPVSATTPADAPAASAASADFYGLLTSAAVSVVSRGIQSATGRGAAGASAASAAPASTSDAAALVPPHVPDADRASFLATQRDRLRTLLSALDREAEQLEADVNADADADADAVRHGSTDDESAPLSRPLSGASGLSKSRSEADFEKIDAESGTEEDKPLRRRRHGGGMAGAGAAAVGATPTPTTAQAGAGAAAGTGGSWMPWGWGSSPGASSGGAGDRAQSSAVEK